MTTHFTALATPARLWEQVEGEVRQAILAQHQQQFGRAPALLTGDRGISSPDNEGIAQAAGVKRVVLPTRGKAPPERVA